MSETEDMMTPEYLILTSHTHFRSLFIVVVTAPMIISSLSQLWQVSLVSLLTILRHSGEGAEASSDEDCATKVNSTGITTINMLIIINTTLTS